MKVSKILVHRFYFVYFYHLRYRGFTCGQTCMSSNVAGIIVKPVDFCYLTCYVCILLLLSLAILPTYLTLFACMHVILHLLGQKSINCHNDIAYNILVAAKSWYLGEYTNVFVRCHKSVYYGTFVDQREVYVAMHFTTDVLG